ncbi:hypothetical protein E2542_SST30784 [Spatholobus suberectus]|nr:hypothetical protein E2542_SST30784 [Spatholobus suberectus]
MSISLFDVLSPNKQVESNPYLGKILRGTISRRVGLFAVSSFKPELEICSNSIGYAVREIGFLWKLIEICLSTFLQDEVINVYPDSNISVVLQHFGGNRDCS